MKGVSVYMPNGKQLNQKKKKKLRKEHCNSNIVQMFFATFFIRSVFNDLIKSDKFAPLEMRFELILNSFSCLFALQMSSEKYPFLTFFMPRSSTEARVHET